MRPARLVYSGNYTVNAGQQNFQWDGRGNNGTKWPDGNYTLAIIGQGRERPDRSAISTEVSGTVDSVDLNASPPTLSIGGQNFTIDKIKQVVRPAL